MNQYLATHESLLADLNTLMTKLKTLKVSGAFLTFFCAYTLGILREKTQLRPHTRNCTRWSSAFQMVDSYFKLVEFFPYITSKNNAFGDCVLGNRDHTKLTNLYKTLVCLFRSK